MGTSTKRRRWAAAVTDQALIQKLGPKGFQLLQRRLTGTRLAFETLADVAPEMLREFTRSEPGWRDCVPADMVELFEALFHRFDKSNLDPGQSPPLDRTLLLKLVKGTST